MDPKLVLGVALGVVIGASVAAVSAQVQRPAAAGRYAVAAAAPEGREAGWTHAWIVDTQTGLGTACAWDRRRVTCEPIRPATDSKP